MDTLTFSHDRIEQTSFKIHNLKLKLKEAGFDVIEGRRRGIRGNKPQVFINRNRKREEHTNKEHFTFSSHKWESPLLLDFWLNSAFISDFYLYRMDWATQFVIEKTTTKKLLKECYFCRNTNKINKKGKVKEITVLIHNGGEEKDELAVIGVTVYFHLTNKREYKLYFLVDGDLTTVRFEFSRKGKDFWLPVTKWIEEKNKEKLLEFGKENALNSIKDIFPALEPLKDDIPLIIEILEMSQEKEKKSLSLADKIWIEKQRYQRDKLVKLPDGLFDVKKYSLGSENSYYDLLFKNKYLVFLNIFLGLVLSAKTTNLDGNSSLTGSLKLKQLYESYGLEKTSRHNRFFSSMLNDLSNAKLILENGNVSLITSFDYKYKFNNQNSFLIVPIFNKLEYIAGTGIIELEMNKKVVEVFTQDTATILLRDGFHPKMSGSFFQWLIYSQLCHFASTEDISSKILEQTMLFKGTDSLRPIHHYKKMKAFELIQPNFGVKKRPSQFKLQVVDHLLKLNRFLQETDIRVNGNKIHIILLTREI